MLDLLHRIWGVLSLLIAVPLLPSVLKPAGPLSLSPVPFFELIPGGPGLWMPLWWGAVLLWVIVTAVVLIFSPE